jgi:hypothetical protein
MMKTTPLLLAPVFSLVLFLAPARAEEPTPITLTPEMQALLAELLKSAGQTAPEAAPVPDPVPAAPNAPVVTAREAKPPLGSTSSLKTSSLTTSTLTAGSLAPSTSLNGRGTAGGSPRLSNDDWRQLFPVRQDRR